MRSLKVIIQFLVLLVLVVFGIYFGSENSEVVRVVVAGTLLDPVPIWLVVLASFFVGAALAGTYFSMEIIRLWLKVRRLQKNTDSWGGGSSKFGSDRSLKDSGRDGPKFGSDGLGASSLGSSSSSTLSRPYVSSFPPPPSSSSSLSS